MKWPRLAPHSRASLADALATVTLALTRPASGRPPARTLRAALYRHAFNPTRRATTTDPAWHGRSGGWRGPHCPSPSSATRRSPGPRSMRSCCGWMAAAPQRAPSPATGQCSTTPPDTPSSSACSPGAGDPGGGGSAPPGADRVLRLPVLRRAAPRRSRSTPQRQPCPGPARAGQADPHRRLPAHRLSVDQHRHAARTALPQAPPGRSGPGRPRAGGSGRPAPAAPAQVWDRAGRAAVPRRSRRLPQRKHLRPHLARCPRDRARPAAGRHVTGLPPVRPAACRPCRCG